MRQKIRNTIIFIIFLSFPIILNYFSPYLSLSGALQGIISGSLLLFGLLFVSSLITGRAFCGWLCPVGCFQDICGQCADNCQQGVIGYSFGLRKSGEKS